ncbi:MAG: hypothetical protein AB7E36_10730 [Salinivirgaceae bacterium]
MKQNYFIFILILLFSCNQSPNDYLEKESAISKEKTEYFLFEIEKKYALNPDKIEPFIEISRELNRQFDLINKSIYNKDFLAAHKYLDNIVTYTKETELFKTNYILKFILPKRTEQWVNVNKNNLNKVLKNDTFGLDMIKLKSELIQFIYSSIERDYYKFNKIFPVIVDSSNIIKVNETYVANIFLAGIDTTQNPQMMVANLGESDDVLLWDKADNERLFNLVVENGVGIYKMTARKPGTKELKGVVLIKNPDGKIEKYMFSKKFKVIK